MIKKCVFVFFAFLLLTGCAADPQDQWQKPQGVTDNRFQSDVGACRSVAEAAVPKGYKPFPNEGDPERDWGMLQQDPWSDRALLVYEKCMKDKGYVLEDHEFHPSQFLKTE